MGEATPTWAAGRLATYNPLASLRSPVGMTLAPPPGFRTLLLVDDEPALLNALKREFRSAPYEVLTATSGEEALAVLADRDVQVILSDYRMPGMSGVEFLAQARALRPDAVRMVLSGYADIGAVIAAINQGNIYKFLNKPWDGEELRAVTAQAFAHHALVRRGAQFSQIFENTSEGIFILDREGRFETVNGAFCAITGYSEADIVGQDHHCLLLPQPGRPTPEFMEELADGGHWRGELWLQRRDGQVFPAALTLSPVCDGNRRLVQVVGLCADITERKGREIALLESEKRFRDFMEFAPVGMAIVNLDGRLGKVNQALCQILGYSREALERLSFEDLTPDEDLAADLAMWRRLRQGEMPVWQAEKRYLRSDGSPVWVELTAAVLRSTQGVAQCFDVQVEDISERRRDQEKIRQLAYFDALTGLPNRRLLQDRLEQALLRARRHQQQVGVLFLDLDHFKQVNDVHGHEVGDELLSAAARRLTRCVRQGDTVARQGGDEFIVVLAEVGAPAGVIRAAETIIASLAAPYELGQARIRVDVITASVGIALFPAHGSDSQTLMKHADLAMYAAKQAGRNGYRIYDEGLAPGG